MYRLRESRIFIEEARFHAFHGVLPQERLTGNDYVVSVCIDCDISKPMQTDNVADTINYASAYQLVAGEMAKPSQLVEHVAHRIVEALLSHFAEAKAVRLKITKCNPPMGSDSRGAGVEVYAEREKTS